MCTSLGIEVGLLHVPEGEEVVVHLVRAGADTRLRILLDENLPRAGPDEGIADTGVVNPVGHGTDVLWEEGRTAVDELREFVNLVQHAAVLELSYPFWRLSRGAT